MFSDPVMRRARAPTPPVACWAGRRLTEGQCQSQCRTRDPGGRDRVGYDHRIVTRSQLLLKIYFQASE
eukprot:736310-Hanusia_phi.AAC.1